MTSFFSAKGALSGTHTLLIGIFVALFATEDSTCGTIKNIYAKGYSRNQVYLSKYVVSFVAVTIISILTVVAAYLYANTIWDNSLEITDHIAVIMIGQLLGIFAYHAIFFAISNSFGKIGAAIALNIIGPMAVSLVLGMCDAFIKSENTKLTSYWLDSLFGNFTATVTDEKFIATGIVLFVLYTVLAIAVGMFTNRRKDIP